MNNNRIVVPLGMIHFALFVHFYRPKERYKSTDLVLKTGKTWIPNKHWELQVTKENGLSFGASFDLSFRRQSHAGLMLCVQVLHMTVYFSVQDIRHWNHTNDCWEEYPEGSDPSF